MKNNKLLSLLIICLFTITLFSCDDDDESTPDWATEVAGTYAADDGTTNKLLVTRTGDNQITVSNSSGSFLDGDITVTITGTQDTSIPGVGTGVGYITNNTNVILAKGEVSLLGQTFTSFSIIVEQDGDTFDGTRE